PLFCLTLPPGRYPPPLHDALPILPSSSSWVSWKDVNWMKSSRLLKRGRCSARLGQPLQRFSLLQRIGKPSLSHPRTHLPGRSSGDRKSTRLNSSHVSISYAVFCVK